MDVLQGKILFSVFNMFILITNCKNCKHIHWGYPPCNTCIYIGGANKCHENHCFRHNDGCV